MGYSHYYRYGGGSSDDYASKYIAALLLVVKCYKDYGLNILEVRDRLIFQGPHDETCETFVLPRQEVFNFRFCKTQQHRYDDVITACLLIMSQVKGFHISSDGEKKDWLKGQALVKKHLDMDIPIRLSADVSTE